jgi:endonuclease YncB( thermonuclease family)
MIMNKRFLTLALIPFIFLSGCGPATSSSAPKEEIDYAHNGSVTLPLDYQGKDFYKDGIGEVTLVTPIDGDTAHFSPVIKTTSSETIKSRFWGIDTPESTGQIQEWGKSASNFTKEKLKAASANGTIVVSSPFTEYKAPEYDSTGTRFVSLIWINTEKKSAPMAELTLLNLWIVQDGFSWVKNVADMPAFSDTFYAAEAQAKDFKLHLFSGEKEPGFNYGDFQNVSLLELKNELLLTMADNTHVNKYDGAKVTVTGTVAGYAGNILYIESYFDSSTGSTKEGGEYAGINIFTGMTTIPSKFSTVNTYIQVSGFAENSENFGFQITGATFPRSSTGTAGEAEVLISAKDNTEEYSLKYFEYRADAAVEGTETVLTKGNNDALFCATKIKGNLYCTGGYDSSDKGEHTLYLSYNDANGARMFFTVYIPFVYKPDATNPLLTYDTFESFKGHTYTLQGILGYHLSSSKAVSYQMVPRTSEDLVQIA